MTTPVTDLPLPRRPLRPNAAFMLAHPAHLLALGFGSGLSRVVPGTSDTTASRRPTMRLNKVDLPTLQDPMATKRTEALR